MRLKPLSGVRVLDFTALPPGQSCTVLLADLGAEIIRIEPPKRKGTPSVLFGQVQLSRAKRSITLDMKSDKAPEILKRLVKTADVIIENAPPGSMEARGFGYAHAQAAKPEIIWCALTGFGQTGPYAQRPAHDLSFMAHSGLLGGLSGEQPWHPGMSVALQAGAFSAVIAIQSALIERSRSGQGGFIDSSLSEAATWMLTAGIEPLSSAPMQIPASPDRRLYSCKDGRFVAVACAEPRTWSALCDGLDLPELKDQLHQWADADAAQQKIAKVFATRGAMEWADTLSSLGAAVTILNHGSQLLADPQIKARGSVVEVGGKFCPATPVRLSTPDGAQTGTDTAPPPMVGDDTADVLASAGFTAEEIAALEAESAV